MLRSTVIVLFGIPGSGKSHWRMLIKKGPHLSSFLRENVDVREIVFDDFEDAMLGGCFTQEAWHQARELALQKLNELLASAAQQQSGCTVILVEDVLYLRSMRREVYRIARDAGVAYLQLHVDTPVDCAIQRNAHRERRVPEESLRRAAAGFEPATSEWQTLPGSTCVAVA
eukprot:EC722930.1.p1 GENE.EC722930.1~~EC722930.1.p1  ORF type:complete len:171 (+),score=10.01 EC722930.1:76-588(+)